MKNEKKTYKARNVHVLRPDVPTIHALEERDELAHRRLPIAVKIRIPKKPVVRCPEVRRRRCQLQWAIPIRLREAVRCRVEHFHFGCWKEAERIERRDLVAVGLEGTNQHRHRNDVVGRHPRRRGSAGWRCGGTCNERRRRRPDRGGDRERPRSRCATADLARVSKAAEERSLCAILCGVIGAAEQPLQLADIGGIIIFIMFNLP